ncbi:DUF1272 domain-containing protein [Winogradskyella echinorum]|uniref:DUF1272 domain-containing protein n=1 Tax=Winogradskyella echinorum TaxID=538189 RepID=A0ABR6Y314_9FLAO|nr:DUF1272 domain-containing protein [Winogradskyella echinorum]MBC3847131.1 DUF1272 domain-containing protein [Winogradskyella echinorum]MBC5751479.1 DUF1272 domain-containing protein [Winogradskyella echinorum]
MLDIRPNCEHCNKDLPNTSTEAMICSFECTYCKTCALDIFENVCPSCSGNFVPRPIRPQKEFEKFPASTKQIFKPKDLEKAKLNSDRFKNIQPQKR